MKKKLLTYLIKAAIFALEFALKRLGKKDETNNSKSKKVIVEDVQINEDTSKAFSNFIKNHTIREK